MSRVGTLFATILPVLAGGLLFGNAAGHADASGERASGFWPVPPDTATGPVMVAQADPWAPSRSRGPRGSMIPPVPPVPPASPVPPLPPGGHGNGISISIHDGQIQIDGIEEMVRDQLERAADILDHLPDVPPEVRERVKRRLQAVRNKLGVRLGKLRSMDVDQIGPEMERMGDQIEREMERLDRDLEQLGARVGRRFAKQFGKDFARNLPPLPLPRRLDRDHSDGGDEGVYAEGTEDDNGDDNEDGVEDGVMLPPNADTDMADPDMRAAISDLKNLRLGPGQRERLARLRADSDREVADARRELEAMSDRLHDTLGDPGAREEDITRQIDLISAKEAAIRKARILAWVRARAVLDDDQRQQVEATAKKRR